MNADFSAKNAAEYALSFALKSGAQEADTLGSESESLAVEVFEGKVSNTEISNSRGIGIRVFKDHKPGYSFTEKLTKDAVETAVKDALDHTKLADPVEFTLPDKNEYTQIDLKSFDSSIEKVDFDKLKNLALKLDELTQKADKRIENVPYVGVSLSISEGVLLNSKGVFYERKSGSMSAYTAAVAALGDNKKMGYYSNGSRTFDFFDAEYMARTAAERATETLGASPVPGGKYTVVFSNRVTPSLLGIFLSAFYAESAQKGQSKLKGKLGEKIASDKLQIICNPHLPEFPGSRLLDGEGVVTKPLTVVENGFFLSFLYNLESAVREKVSPTGHSARGMSGKPGTSFSNLIVPAGVSKLEALLGAENEILFIDKLEGSAGCSSTSGEISIGAQGFLYKNGIRMQAVDQITLNSNFFDFLKNIRDISNAYSDSFSPVKIPDLLVSDIYIAG